ncbi:hypothetical protein C8Q75DRAFT_891765 [Abortiporus biennis]|nr:hypothetical protein C8Q75DRAFT_891765 [Abortiporus biennis]
MKAYHEILNTTFQTEISLCSRGKRHSVFTAAFYLATQQSFATCSSDSSPDLKYDGCSTLKIPESAEEVSVMLSALYDGIKFYHWQARKSLPFKDVSSMLTVGSKYKIKELRDGAVQRLEKYFPSNLREFTSLSLEDRLPGFCEDDEEKVVLEELELLIQYADKFQVISTISLARKCELPQILPQLFYLCAQLPYEPLIESFTRRSLSNEDFAMILNGYSTLLRNNMDATKPLITHERSPQCTSQNACTNILKELVEEQYQCWFMSTDNFRTAGSWFDVAVEETGICDRCVKHIKQYHEKERKASWKKLGDLYDIDEWSGTV